MLRPGTQDTIISRRVNLPTKLDHAGIVRELSPKLKAQSFFSARVAEAHILNKLREVTDGFSRGEFGIGEARNRLKDFLSGEGYDPHRRGLRNLASTARLNLIVSQNAATAHAAAEWKRMHDPDAMAVFPFVRYHAHKDGHTRSAHADLDGKIFRKDDPFLLTHTPPWEFNCRCYLEEITAKQAGEHEDLIQKPTPPDQVRVDSASGYVFNPEHAFEEFDLSGVKGDAVRGDIREQAEIEFGDQVTFANDNSAASFAPKPYRTFAEENLPSAKTWTAAPSPKRISPETARKMLETGIVLKAGDGQTVLLDQAVLEHWERETSKTQEAVISRLACLQYAIETVLEPVERWDQETQCRYLKAFQKNSGGFEGCMVCVTADGKCRTYFLPSVNQMDRMRSGLKRWKK